MKKIVVFLLILFFSSCCLDTIKTRYFPPIELDTVTVTKVIDGDTIEILIDGENERVRLVGIDTPEPYSNNNEKKMVWASG